MNALSSAFKSNSSLIFSNFSSMPTKDLIIFYYSNLKSSSYSVKLSNLNDYIEK